MIFQHMILLLKESIFMIKLPMAILKVFGHSFIIATVKRKEKQLDSFDLVIKEK